MRPTAADRIFVALLLAGLAACGGSPRSRDTLAKDDAALFEEHRARVRTEERRAEAARRESDDVPGVFPKLQLRAQGMSANNLEQGTNIRGSARLSVERPWTVSAFDDSKTAEADAADHLVRAERWEARALTCQESVRGKADKLEAAQIAAVQAGLESTEGWIADWIRAGTLDPVTAMRAEMQLGRRMIELRGEAGANRVSEQLGVLADPRDVPSEALVLDLPSVRRRISEAHPRVALHRAFARGHGSRASAESLKRVPWFSFIGVDYNTESDGMRDLAARVAIDIPIDDGSGGASDRFGALRESETWEAEQEAVTLSRLAAAAIGALRHFETNAKRIVRLEDQAAASEALSATMLLERRDSPERVIQLLTDALAARRAALEARTDAGVAACTLEYATGVAYGDWPRESSAGAVAP